MRSDACFVNNPAPKGTVVFWCGKFINGKYALIDKNLLSEHIINIIDF